MPTESKMTLERLTQIMRQRRNEHAPGGECGCWQGYVESCFRTVGCAPWNDERAEELVPASMALYWVSIDPIEGRCADDR